MERNLIEFRLTNKQTGQPWDIVPLTEDKKLDSGLTLIEKKRIWNREYYQRNKESIRTRARNNLSKRKTPLEYKRAYREKNKERINFLSREWARTNHRKNIKPFKTPRVKKTKEELRAKYNQTRRERYYMDMKNPIFRLSRNFANCMYLTLKGKKAGKKWESFVDYSIEQLKRHLEGQFREGMRWDNYGKVWQVDHIVPRSFFKFQSLKSEEFRRCWSLNNLQPLFTHENIRKSNKILLPAPTYQPSRLESLQKE